MKIFFTILLLSILNQTFAQNVKVNEDSVTILNAEIVKRSKYPYVLSTGATFKVTFQNNLNDTICEIHYDIKFHNRKGQLLGVHKSAWWALSYTDRLLMGNNEYSKTREPIEPGEKITYYSSTSKSDLEPNIGIVWNFLDDYEIGDAKTISIEITSVITTEHKRFLEKDKKQKENERLERAKKYKENQKDKTVTKVPSSSEALNELRLTKEKLDLGLITKDEYEKIKERLRIFIK